MKYENFQNSMRAVTINSEFSLPGLILKLVSVATMIFRYEELSVHIFFILSSLNSSSLASSFFQTTLGIGIPAKIHSMKNDSPI